MNKNKIRQLLESKLLNFYGGDTEMIAKFSKASNIEVEKEVKRVYNITSNVSYFGG